MGIVLLVDNNGDAVRLVRNLRNSIDDKTVILLSVVTRYYVKTVAEIEKSGEVVLISGFAPSRDVFLGKLLRKSVELSGAFFV